MVTYSIIKKSELESATRLDAEYYQPKYLVLSKKLRNNKYHRKFGDLLVGGSYGVLPDSDDYIDSSEKESIYLIRGVDARGLQLEEKDLIKVPKKYFNERSSVAENDLLFLVKGATIDSEDSVVIVPRLEKLAIYNGSLFKPSLRDILPEFVYVFMRTKFFFPQKRRLVSNLGIEYNSAQEIKFFDFICPPIDFQLAIKAKVNLVFQKINDSKKLYSEAENLLLGGLGLEDFGEKEELWSVVNFEEVLGARRVDAEYFNSDFEFIKTKLENVKTEKLEDFVSIEKGFEPGSEAYQEEGKLFIRVSSLSKDGITDKDQKYLSEDLYQELKEDFQPRVGEILLTKDATPGIAYVLKEETEGIISGGVLRLKVKEEIDPEYITLCINSIIGQSQVERDAGGSIIAHWKPEQVKNLIIPILLKDKQNKIADLVRKSHEARRKAKELLEEAKRKVEELIEDN